MWTLIIRISGSKPAELVLPPGKTIIGRKSENAIPIADSSASRLHAEITLDPKTDQVQIVDLGSTNGTYVNREQISGPKVLSHGDVIRIGGTQIDVVYQSTAQQPQAVHGTHRFTRELVLESIDKHAVLVYEVARKLNMVLDLPSALAEVSSLMQQAMGADRCEVILARDFDRLAEMQFPKSIAESAIQNQSTVIVQDLARSPYAQASESSILMGVRTALCVPIISQEKTLGLIYMYKTHENQRPFGEKDLQLAVAISHQAALTIQRMDLLEAVKNEQRVRSLLQRFVSPAETDLLVKQYMNTGQLPGLMERQVSVLFADLANSTAIAERIGGNQFGQLLDRYYKQMTDRVFAYNGVIKFMGDGIMGVFGMDVTSSEAIGSNQHVFDAVNAGFSILKHLETEDYGEDLHMGVGINSGKTMVGYVGTQDRVELTAVGDIVNVAFRLEKYARPNRLLVGAETALEIAGRYPLKDLGPHELRGRKQPTRVYEVLP